MNSPAAGQERIGSRDLAPKRKEAPAAQSPLTKSSTLLARSHVVPWPFSDVDAEVPPVMPGVSCPLSTILQSTALRVKDLVANLERFTATERIENAKMDRAGKWTKPQARTVKYLAFINELRPGVLSVEETRAETHASTTATRAFESTGLAAFAFVFHPYYAGDFQMTCEGLGTWQGRPAWQVHFTQRPDMPPRFHSFVVGQRRFSVKLRGRAWIMADSFQVARVEVDLCEPVKEIRLLMEHLEIQYQPVHFVQRDLQLWLPQSANLYLDFRGGRYRHAHRLSDFLLFSVDTSQQVKDTDKH
jgi:hypothetical protein